MAFVRAKRQGDRSYYQLVENRREGGRVRQRVLAHLGHYSSLEAAIGRDAVPQRQGPVGMNIGRDNVLWPSSPSVFGISLGWSYRVQKAGGGAGTASTGTGRTLPTSRRVARTTCWPR